MSTKLGNICSFQSGGTPAKGNAEYFNGNIPWVTTTALNGSKIDERDAVDWITEKAINETAAKIVPSNSIMVGTRVGVGKVAINVVDMSTSQDIISLLNIDETVWSKEFLCKFLQGKNTYLTSQARGATIKGIKIDVLANLELPNIALDQQRHISEIIDRARLLIIARKQKLQKLDDLIKARFVEMFGEPIANPMKWPVKRLKELSTLITNGNTPKGGSENYVESGITFLRSQNVWRNHIELDDVAFIDEATHKSMRKSSLRYKDILITKTGRINTENSSLGRAALFLGADNSANINGHVYLVRLNGTIVPEFVVTILTGEAYRRYIRKVCVGGIDKRQINVDQVEDFPIIIPPYEQQKRFATFAAQVDKSKAAVQKSLEEMQLLFDSLMQQYFG